MEIEEMKGDLPAEVARLTGELEALGAAIEATKNELQELEKDHRHRTAEVADNKEQLSKYQDQLVLISTNRAYDALMTEIDGSKQVIENHEFALLENEEKNQQLHDTQKVDELTLEEKRGLFAGRQKELEATIAETLEKAEELERQRVKLVGKIDSRDTTVYERIRAARDGEAVVRLSRGSCGSCFTGIPAQTQVEVRAMNKIITCHSCGVILYDEEA
jgi:hypothetical protein